MNYILQQIEILNNYKLLIYPFVFFGILAIISLFADKFNIIKFANLILLPAIYIFVLQNISGNYELVVPFFSKQLFLNDSEYKILSPLVLGFILINIYYFLEKTTRFYLFSYNILIGSLLCLFLVKDLISFFVFLEIFSLSLFLLILHSNKKAALTYFVVSSFAGVLFFGAIASLNIQTSDISIRPAELNYNLAQILITCAILIFVGFIFFSYYLSNAITQSSNKTASIIVFGKSKAMLILLFTLFPFSNFFVILGTCALTYFVILGLFENSYKKSFSFLYLAQSAFYVTIFGFYEDKNLNIQHFVPDIFLLISMLIINSQSRLTIFNKILISIVFLCLIFSASPTNHIHKIASFLLNLLAIKIWLNLVLFDKEKTLEKNSIKTSAGLILAISAFFYSLENFEFINLIEFKLISLVLSVIFCLLLNKVKEINLKEAELVIAYLANLLAHFLKEKFTNISLIVQNTKFKTTNLVYASTYKYFSRRGKLENSTKLSNTISIVAILLVILFILFLI